METDVFDFDDEVHITVSEVHLLSRTVKISEIRCVNIRTVRSDGWARWVWPLITAEMLAVNAYSLTSGPNVDAVFRIGCLLLIGCLAIALFIAFSAPFVLRQLSFIYILELSGTFGTMSPLATDDAQYVEQLAKAIQSSIAGEQGHKSP